MQLNNICLNRNYLNDTDSVIFKSACEKLFNIDD